jgi:hypothetical protein
MKYIYIYIYIEPAKNGTTDKTFTKKLNNWNNTRE